MKRPVIRELKVACPKITRGRLADVGLCLEHPIGENIPGTMPKCPYFEKLVRERGQWQVICRYEHKPYEN